MSQLLVRDLRVHIQLLTRLVSTNSFIFKPPFSTKTNLEVRYVAVSLELIKGIAQKIFRIAIFRTDLIQEHVITQVKSTRMKKDKMSEQIIKQAVNMVML